MNSLRMCQRGNPFVKLLLAFIGVTPMRKSQTTTLSSLSTWTLLPYGFIGPEKGKGRFGLWTLFIKGFSGVQGK
ncbi:hypothetical protein Tco_0238094 [Tanacetum coccineum]